MGKGSKRRPEDREKLDKHWDEIDWSKKDGKKQGRAKR